MMHLTYQYSYFIKLGSLNFPIHNRAIFAILSSFQSIHLKTDSLGRCLYNTNRFKADYVRHSKLNVQSLWEDKDISKQSKQLDQVSPTGKTLSYKQEDIIYNYLETIINRVAQITPQDWDVLRNSVLEIQGTIDEENIDAIILNKCSDVKSLSLGKSYFLYLKSRGKKLNRACYGNILRLFYICANDCMDSDLNDIGLIYRELLQDYPLLDANTAEKVIAALSITQNWKEYEKMFEFIKMFYYPRPSVYSIVIKTAFEKHEFDLGWKLIEEMQSQGQTPEDCVFIYLLEVAQDNTKDETLVRVLQFLSNCKDNPSLALCEALKQRFDKASVYRKGTFTSVSQSGVCKNCRIKLEPAWVSQEDYDELRTTFLNPVLIGKDIFLKTQPEELSDFLNFLEKTSPYDIVLDGLNIALGTPQSSPSVFASQLKHVVKYFAAQDKTILVLGRKHMTKWPKKDMQHIYSNAQVFLAEDISQDDPFLLYATLYSGLGTRFVSRDMMRGHLFLLSNPKVRDTFRRWQMQHQCFILHIEPNGTVHVQEPVPYMQTIQCNSRGDWHIPYIIRENLTTKTRTDNFHKHWLCLVNQSTNQSAKPYGKPKVWESKSAGKKDVKKSRW